MGSPPDKYRCGTCGAWVNPDSPKWASKIRLPLPDGFEQAMCGLNVDNPPRGPEGQCAWWRPIPIAKDPAMHGARPGSVALPNSPPPDCKRDRSAKTKLES